MAKNREFPETESCIDAGADADGAAHYIRSSKSVGRGHEDSMNRMPDPNAEWTNEESGTGLGNPKS